MILQYVTDTPIRCWRLETAELVKHASVSLRENPTPDLGVTYVKNLYTYCVHLFYKKTFLGRSIKEKSSQNSALVCAGGSR
jgi:hypothetical protein